MTKDTFVTEAIVASIVLRTINAIAKYNVVSDVTKAEIIYKQLQNNLKENWDKGD